MQGSSTRSRIRHTSQGDAAAANAAGGIFFDVVHDYEGAINGWTGEPVTHNGKTYSMIIGSFSDTFDLTEVAPLAAGINSAEFSITHTNNYEQYGEEWTVAIVTDNATHQLGKLTFADSSAGWTTSSFDVTEEFIDMITSQDLWSLKINLEQSEGGGGLVIADATFEIKYSTVPEPGTMLLLGLGLLGFAGIQRKRSAQF